MVWVGFDNNQPHHLSGAQGALPLWESFMKKILPYLSSEDFNWPEGVVRQTIQLQKKDSEQDETIRSKTGNFRIDQEVQLIFEK